MRNVLYMILLCTTVVTLPIFARDYDEGESDEPYEACEQAFRIAFCSGSGCDQSKANDLCRAKKCDAVCAAAKCKGGSSSQHANACDGTNPSCGLGSYCSAGYCGCAGPLD